jgi:hypothetical protein
LPTGYTFLKISDRWALAKANGASAQLPVVLPSSAAADSEPLLLLLTPVDCGGGEEPQQRLAATRRTPPEAPLTSSEHDKRQPVGASGFEQPSPTTADVEPVLLLLQPVVWDFEEEQEQGWSQAPQHSWVTLLPRSSVDASKKSHSRRVEEEPPEAPLTSSDHDNRQPVGASDFQQPSPTTADVEPVLLLLQPVVWDFEEEQEQDWSQAPQHSLVTLLSTSSVDASSVHILPTHKRKSRI